MEVPVLSILQNISCSQYRRCFRVERKIPRQFLVDVAPDREEVLINCEEPIEGIRQSLKINTCGLSRHWLYQSRYHRDVTLQQLQTDCMSIYTDEKSCNMSGEFNGTLGDSQTSDSPSSLNNVDMTEHKESPAIWGPPLSTSDILISPRRLGPTHSLIVFTESPLRVFPRYTRKRSLSVSPRHKQPILFPEAIEMPVNDLLLVLNIPNLNHSMPVSKGPCGFPHRLQNELPPIFLQVPHLETFPPLVRYFHTMNQEELFKQIIPDQIREVISVAPCHSAIRYLKSGTNNSCIRGSRKSLCRIISSLFSRLRFSCLPRSSRQLYEHEGESQTALALDFDSEHGAVPAAKDGESDQIVLANDDFMNMLVQTVALLDGLCDNLHYVGYYEKDLWKELDFLHKNLVMAVTSSSKI